MRPFRHASKYLPRPTSLTICSPYGPLRPSHCTPGAARRSPTTNSASAILSSSSPEPLEQLRLRFELRQNLRQDLVHVAVTGRRHGAAVAELRNGHVATGERDCTEPREPHYES